ANSTGGGGQTFATGGSISGNGGQSNVETSAGGGGQNGAGGSREGAGTGGSREGAGTGGSREGAGTGGSREGAGTGGSHEGTGGEANDAGWTGEDAGLVSTKGCTNPVPLIPGIDTGIYACSEGYWHRVVARQCANHLPRNMEITAPPGVVLLVDECA